MTDKKLLRLMRDFGYDVAGDCLLQLGSRMFAERTVGRFKSTLGAAEYLCPIIRDDEYTARLNAIQNGVGR